ncbi:dihydropteroate synthase [Segetibacter sp. 3557_3]|uniref:dihydropteroate synthase n=1 Tax=Segetibacter sp. 3557_3 TaxID=2547429 RepID=UPI001058E1BB|nr:dihydropteroate synthase [Segetibacter sp. 3557_3]TDH29165.1 dihydropteroate synthase [Segetibacter sp. 3557_3]
MFTLNCRGRLLTIDQPVVMGIINITPDSFYEGSRMDTSDNYLLRASEMISAGATFLDIGGQSTRPGSQLLSAEDELNRVIPAIAQIHQRFPEAILSVDTFYAAVARAAIEAGAGIVNDISAGNMDDGMIGTVADLGVPYIAMHMLGTPQTMHKNPVYNNLVTDLLDFFIHKIASTAAAGIKDVIIDPGFGFGKTIAHNFELLHKLEAFSILNKPLLVGLSRKSTIYKTLQTTAADALNGTSVLNTIAVLKGANILRVHDVKEAVEVIKLLSAYQQQGVGK